MKNTFKALAAATILVLGIGASSTAQAHIGAYWGTRGSGQAFYCTGGQVPLAPSGPNGDECTYGHYHSGGRCYVMVDTWRWGSTNFGGTLAGSHGC